MATGSCIAGVACSRIVLKDCDAAQLFVGVIEYVFKA